MENTNEHKYFSETHASMESQLFGSPVNISDSNDVRLLIGLTAADPLNFELRIRLGDALCWQLRYLEAVNQYSAAIALSPKSFAGYYKRAQRYFCLQQFHKALADYRICDESDPGRFDLKYKIGLLWYCLEEYKTAVEYFNTAEQLCPNAEMLVAVVYWRHLARIRTGKTSDHQTETDLFKIYPGLDIGHHAAYNTAVELFQEEINLEETAQILEKTDNDMDYVTILYAVYHLILSKGEKDRSRLLLRKLLKRSYYWPSFTYTAALNDYRRMPDNESQNNYYEYINRTKILE